MSTTRGVRILVGSALASSVILLGGCASSGTVSSSANGGANPLTGGLTSHSSTSAADTTGGSTTSSDDSSSTTSSSSSSDNSSSTTSGGLTGGLTGNSDPGCQAAMSDITSGSQALANMASNPAGALSGIRAIGDKMHTDAGKATDPAHASVIKKVGDDYMNLASQAASGKAPDMGPMTNDVTAMMTACAG